MSNQPASRLAAIMRGDYQKIPVTPVTPVTGEAVTGTKPLKLQGLHGLQVKNSYVPKSIYRPVTSLVTDLSHVPPIYRHGMAELIAHCPVGLFWKRHEWAVQDALTFWGGQLVSRLLDYSDGPNDGMWKPEHLFTAPEGLEITGGLFWILRGAAVRAIGPDCAFMDSGEAFDLEGFANAKS